MFLRVSPVQALWCVRQNSARGRLSTGTMGKLSSALSVCVLVAGLAGAAAFFRPSSVRAARTVMQEGKVRHGPRGSHIHVFAAFHSPTGRGR